MRGISDSESCQDCGRREREVFDEDAVGVVNGRVPIWGTRVFPESVWGRCGVEAIAFRSTELGRNPILPPTVLHRISFNPLLPLRRHTNPT